MTFEIFGNTPSEEKVTFRLIEEDDEIIMWACDEKGEPHENGRIVGINRDSGKLHLWSGIRVSGLPISNAKPSRRTR